MGFVCHFCGKSFTSVERLRAHKAVHDETKMLCHICDKEFEGKKKFNNHIQSHQTFECEVCHQTIKMNSRSNHSRKCGKKEIKAFACSECPYEVDRKARLDLHKEKMHGTPIFEKCTFCKKEFGSRNELDVHVKSHATPSRNPQEFSCEICERNFASKKSLYVHTHKFHTNTKVVNTLGFGVFKDSKTSIRKTKEKFQCEKCGFSTDR